MSLQFKKRSWMFVLAMNRIQDDFVLAHQDNQTFAYRSIINLFSNLFVSIRPNYINLKKLILKTLLLKVNASLLNENKIIMKHF